MTDKPFQSVSLCFMEDDWKRLCDEGTIGQEADKLIARACELMGIERGDSPRWESEHVFGWEAPRVHDLHRTVVCLVKSGGKGDPFGEIITELTWKSEETENG